VPAGKNQPIWVDVFVPRNTQGGVYHGTFTVTSDQGSVGGTLALTVWNFTLPVKPTLKSDFLFWTDGTLKAQQELLRNRIAPGTATASDFSTLVTGYGYGQSNTGFYSGADIGNCTMSAPPTVGQFQAAAAPILQAGMMAYNYSADEIDSCTGLYPSIIQWAYNMHQAGVNNLVTMAPVPALYSDGSGTGRSAVDIWAMLPVMYDGATTQVAQVLAKGDSVWSYNTMVQDAYSPKWQIDFAPANFRIQPGFISQSLGLTGILYWRLDKWSNDPWNLVNNVGVFNASNYPGEGMLVYPGAQVGIPQSVAPSMRLKWLREGIEDYEYVDLLKKAGRGAWAINLARSVGADWVNWTQDPSRMMAVRNQMGDALDQIGAAALCDIDADGVVNIVDVQGAANQVLGMTPCTADLNGDGKCDVIDMQRVITAALGGSCNTGP
jgi:hypothetical protein